MAEVDDRQEPREDRPWHRNDEDPGEPAGLEDGPLLDGDSGEGLEPVDVDNEEVNEPCCLDHNIHCEPPSELCCADCTEAAHDTFPIRHADGTPCVLTTALMEER